jgi:hypothetical protein
MHLRVAVLGVATVGFLAGMQGEGPSRGLEGPAVPTTPGAAEMAREAVLQGATSDPAAVRR